MRHLKYIFKIVYCGLNLYAWNMYAQATNSSEGIEIKPSPKGMYLLISDRTLSSIPEIKKITISRSINGGKEVELGGVSPASSIAEFENIITKDALWNIAQLKKLNTKDEAYAYTKQHPQLKDYGILALNLDLGVALGAYFLDKNTSDFKKGDKIIYVINFVGRENKSVYASIEYGQLPKIEKPLISSKLISDSLLEVTWMLNKRNSPEVMFGNVYVQEGSPAPFQKVGTTMAVNLPDGDSILLKWTQPTKKGYCYSFFVIPTTIAFYEGIASDTTAIISLKENSIVQPSDLNAKDTTNGIFLSWHIPAKIDAQRLWLLQRTHEVSKNYINIATLDPLTTSYIDHEVLPSEQYYYRIRTITLNNDTLSPSSHNSARHESKAISPIMPDNITVTSSTKGVQIKWNKVKMTDVIGYYVYRSITENNKMEQISMLLKDTTFIDTLPMYGRNKYIYGVRAFTGGNMMGFLGTSSIYSPSNFVKPFPPSGLLYYVQKGSVHFSWDDASLRDNAVTGYNIYRKSGAVTTIDASNPLRSGFTLIHSTTTHDWDDITTSVGMQTYALTTIDQYGNESDIGQMISVSTEPAHITVPENFTVRKTTKGIAIEWDIAAISANDTYIIFRRAVNESTATKVATTPASRLQYIDNTVKTNTLYYYALESKTAIGTSERSEEKVVKN